MNRDKRLREILVSFLTAVGRTRVSPRLATIEFQQVDQALSAIKKEYEIGREEIREVLDIAYHQGRITCKLNDDELAELADDLAVRLSQKG